MKQRILDDATVAKMQSDLDMLGEIIKRAEENRQRFDEKLKMYDEYFDDENN